MNHYRWEELAREQMNPLFARRVIHGERLTLAYCYIKKGCKVPLHSHENEQISVVQEGCLRFRIGDQDKDVSAGEAVQIPPHVPHLAEALEDTVCLDIFNPVREDWLRGEDAYLRNSEK